MSTFDFLAFPVRRAWSPWLFYLYFSWLIYAVLPFRRLSVKKPDAGSCLRSRGLEPCFPPHSPFTSGIFKNFTVTYGSLAAVIPMMLWLYFCICILFMGAEINWWWEASAPSRTGTWLTARISKRDRSPANAGPGPSFSLYGSANPQSLYIFPCPMCPIKRLDLSSSPDIPFSISHKTPRPLLALLL